jgi:hypothetical protein
VPARGFTYGCPTFYQNFDRHAAQQLATVANRRGFWFLKKNSVNCFFLKVFSPQNHFQAKSSTIGLGWGGGNQFFFNPVEVTSWENGHSKIWKGN